MISLQSTLSRFFSVGFLVATLVLAVVFYFVYQKIQLLSESSNMMTHTQGVRLGLSNINSLLQESTLLHRRFLVSKDSTILKELTAHENDITRNLQLLDSMPRDNPVLQHDIDSLRQLINMYLVLMKNVTRPDFQNMSAVWMENQAVLDSTLAQISRMDQVEAGILRDHEVSREKSTRMAPFFAFLLLLLALLFVAFSYLRIRNDLQRSRRQLKINLENTQRIVQLNETLQHAEQISQTGNWRMNLQTGEHQYSSNVYRLIGYEPDSFEPALNNWLHMVHPDDQKLVINFVETTQTTKAYPAPIVYRLTRRDGQLRYFSASGRIVTDAAGEQTMIGTIQDVTEAHRLRKELEERTRFAELLIESSVDMIAVYDQDLRYTVWNQRCVELLDLQKEDVLGKHVFEVFPTLRGQEIIMSLYKALDGQSSYFPPQPSLISKHHYENFVQPLFNDTGGVRGVLTVTHDVTESYQLRQELEERSRFAETIIESSIDIIVTYDTELRITAWNKKSEEVFQLTREQVLGRYVEEVFPSIASTQRVADLRDVLSGKTMQYEPEELHPYGIHADLYLLPLKDHNGEVTGVLSISHDLTDVVRSAAQLATLNQSLENKNQELANTNAELASFSYVASHDLQEPLRKIQAFGSRILANESDRLSDTGKDAFRRMQSAADRMQQLIEDLLTYSRTNTEPGEFAVQDLSSILREAEMEVSEVIAEKRAVIEADQLPNARVVAFQFRQLLTNLLSNALKYQRPDVAPYIRITCAIISGADVPQTAAPAERYYCIAVQDNGIGFEQQYAERIFELFQRLHGRSDYKGTGIGLAICRKIMQNHHGYLLAEGRLDAGATFTIYLPV